MYIKIARAGKCLFSCWIYSKITACDRIPTIIVSKSLIIALHRMMKNTVRLSSWNDQNGLIWLDIISSTNAGTWGWVLSLSLFISLYRWSLQYNMFLGKPMHFTSTDEPWVSPCMAALEHHVLHRHHTGITSKIFFM